MSLDKPERIMPLPFASRPQHRHRHGVTVVPIVPQCLSAVKNDRAYHRVGITRLKPSDAVEIFVVNGFSGFYLNQNHLPLRIFQNKVDFLALRSPQMEDLSIAAGFSQRHNLVIYPSFNQVTYEVRPYLDVGLTPSL